MSVSSYPISSCFALHLEGMCFASPRDANRAMLVALSKQAGGEVVDLGILKDTREALEIAVEQALGAGVDVIVSSGAQGGVND